MVTSQEPLADRVAAVREFVASFPTQKAAAAAIGASDSQLSKALGPDATPGRLTSIEGAIARWQLSAEKSNRHQAGGGQGTPPAVIEQRGRENALAFVPDETLKPPPGFAVIQFAEHGHGASVPGRDNGDGPRGMLVREEEVVRAVGMGYRGPVLKSFAAGPSMEPWLADGEAIWFIPFETFIDGARYALWMDGGRDDIVKRVYRRGDTIKLHSDNPAVQPLTLKSRNAVDDYCDENEYVDEEGNAVRIEFRGRVVHPHDRAPSIMGQLAEFARSLAR